MSTLINKNTFKLLLIVLLFVLCIPFLGIIMDVVLNIGRYIGSTARILSEGNICPF